MTGFTDMLNLSITSTRSSERRWRGLAQGSVDIGSGSGSGDGDEEEEEEEEEQEGVEEESFSKEATHARKTKPSVRVSELSWTYTTPWVSRDFWEKIRCSLEDEETRRRRCCGVTPVS